MIAQLVDGRMIPCPKQGRDGVGHLHTNLQTYYEKHLDKAAADGYYPVKYTPQPIGYYTSAWELINGEIVQTWTPYTPHPEPPVPDIYKMQADIDYLLMMGDYDGGDL